MQVVLCVQKVLCPFSCLLVCRVESVQGFRAFFLRLLGKEIYHSKAPETEIMPVAITFGLDEFEPKICPSRNPKISGQLEAQKTVKT